MDQLTVIRASAGSGKTHALTGYYLNLLLANHEQYFKGILAVTFTNKATAEMKVRVIEELYKLASGGESHFIKDLTQNLNVSEQDIRHKASDLLKIILHEYSWFSIETIDTFFQRVIRAFSRELGLPGNYALELDTTVAVEYAVDQLIDNSGSDKQLLSWLTRFTLEKIQDGKSWDFKDDLLTLGKELFNEAFVSHSDEMFNALADYDKLVSIRDSWIASKVKFEKCCKELGREVLQIIENAGLDAEDFHGKTRGGVVPVFKKVIDVDIVNANDIQLPHWPITIRLLESPDNWPASDNKDKSAVSNLAGEMLIPLLKKIVGFIEENYTEYASIKVMLAHLFPLGILVKLGEKLKEYRLEKNTFILSDATALINKLVEDNDASFIYEKMGNRYRHFLIDEFQDTSAMQWLNFKPLIDNSLAQANDCLLVGDVKQSIYRWRNGEWDILARQIKEEYTPEMLSMKQLVTNWRSFSWVVNFNNSLFPLLVDRLGGELSSEFSGAQLDFGSETELLQSIYNDVKQELPPGKPDGGNVQLSFYSTKDAKADPMYYKDPLLTNINWFLSQGYKPGDIAVLVRDKKDGQRIADLLIELNAQGSFSSDIQVISNESLFLKASPAVQLLIACLEYVNSPDELLYQMRLAACYERITNTNTEASFTQELSELSAMLKGLPAEFTGQAEWLRSLPLYELIEYIAGVFNLHLRETELPYIYSFYDLVHDFVQTNPGNIEKFLEFWENKGQQSSVTASEAQNAIRIVTIHKSKGLEYRAVILPFCNWNLDQKSKSLYWVKVPDNRIQGLPIFPVNHTKNLKHTIFAKAYYQEKFRSYVDNMNLLYVALTRAVESLVVLSVYSEADKSKEIKIKTVGDLLYRSVSTSADTSITDYYNSELKTFCLGFTESNTTEDTNDTANDLIPAAEYSSAMDRLFFSAQAAEYFQENDSVVTGGKLRGKVLHEILAKVHTHNDINTCIGEAVYKGLVEPREGVDLQQHIEQCLKSERVAHWFDGSGKVLNESELLLPGGNSKRPDRVIVWDDKVHVVDYKTGSKQEELSHKKQVNEYVNILLKMAYKHVQGYLWYIDMNEVVEVE